MKLYIDEDTAQRSVIAALRSKSVDVLTSLEAGRNEDSDEDQLAFAASAGRVLVTCNASDFASLHAAWAAQGRWHSGVLIVPQQRYSTGETVRRMLRFAACGLNPGGGIFYLSCF